MDPSIRHALDNDLTVDLSTIGRRSGLPRRIEIWLLHQDGRYFITGTPGRRDWLDNVRADPRVVVHLKQAVRVDLDATATEVTDAATRRRVLEHHSAKWYRDQAPLHVLVQRAPMMELIAVLR